MSCSDDDISKLRRMAAEQTTATYTDSALAGMIEKYPIIDSDGFFPDEDDWTDTYDLNSAAADVWAEKAATVAANFDFSADGASFSRSQEFQMATRLSAFYRSRRNLKAVRMIQSPKEVENSMLDDDYSNS
jgi:hypothetical protein